MRPIAYNYKPIYKQISSHFSPSLHHLELFSPRRRDALPQLWGEGALLPGNHVAPGQGVEPRQKGRAEAKITCTSKQREKQ